MNKQNSMQTRNQDTAEGIQQRPAVAPAVDVFENQDEILVIADLPGVTKEETSIHLEKGKLTLEARRRDNTSEGNALAMEFRPFDYRRTFLVPQGIDADKIVAELTSGVLRVHLPKAATLKPRQIPIRTG